MPPVTALCQRRQGPGPRILAVVSHGQHGTDSMRMAERLAFKARAMEHTKPYEALDQDAGQGNASGEARTAGAEGPATVSIDS